eukprot:412319-Rhodomonas_salina.2
MEVFWRCGRGRRREAQEGSKGMEAGLYMVGVSNQSMRRMIPRSARMDMNEQGGSGPWQPAQCEVARCSRCLNNFVHARCAASKPQTADKTHLSSRVLSSLMILMANALLSSRRMLPTLAE